MHLYFSGEKNVPDVKLVGAPRDLARHEIRLAAELEPDPEAPSREDKQNSPRSIAGREELMFKRKHSGLPSQPTPIFICFK